MVRGDVIVKLQEYDARDVRNIDAQNMFRSAGNHIRIVVHRDSKLIVASNMRGDTPTSRSPSAVPPFRPEINLLQFDFNDSAGNFLSLPQTNFQAIGDNASSRPTSRASNHQGFSDYASSRPTSRASNFSPMPTRDHQQDELEEVAAITSQVS